jgi:5-methylcytosine-specific restriction endonuclease McrA
MERKRLAPLLEAEARENRHGLGAAARALLERRRAPAKRLVTRRADRAAKRAARRERVAELRRQAMERDGGRCVLCGTPATDEHHLLSGPIRRSEERLETVAMLCRKDHRLAHAGEIATLRGLSLWCARLGYREAEAAVSRRLHDALRAGGQT